MNILIRKLEFTNPPSKAYVLVPCLYRMEEGNNLKKMKGSHVFLELERVLLESFLDELADFNLISPMHLNTVDGQDVLWSGFDIKTPTKAISLFVRPAGPLFKVSIVNNAAPFRRRYRLDGSLEVDLTEESISSSFNWILVEISQSKCVALTKRKPFLLGSVAAIPMIEWM